MNWTEGNLARHSRGRTAKNEVLRRQKQHFAKARSRLLNGAPRRSPITISFLNSPVARQPAEHASFPEHDGPFLPEDQDHFPSSRSSSSIERGQQPINDPVEEHHHRDPFVSQPEITRNGSSTKQPATRKAETPLERASREKRRKLLDKTDWAGLTMQQPLDLTFPGQMRVGRIWSNTDPADRGTTEKSRHVVRERSVNREESIRYRNGGRRLQPTGQRIKVQVGSQDTYIGDGSSPLSMRRRRAGSDRGNSTEISTVISELSQRSSCRDDWVRQCRKSSSRSVDEDLMERGSNSHRSSRELRRTLEVASPSNSPTEPSAAHVAYASLALEVPAPKPGTKSQILPRSSSLSLYSVSLEVEVGEPTSRPDAMDIAENERWKTLADPSDLLIPLIRSSSLLNSPRLVPNISPGISEMMIQNDNPDIESTRSVHTEVGDRPSHESRRALAANARASVGDGGTPAAQFLKSQTALLGTSKPKGPKVQNDMDESMEWMKFVFDSDSDEFERCAMQEAARLAAREMRPSKSPEETTSTEASTECFRSIPLRAESPEVSADAFMESSDDVASTTITGASRMATHGSTHFSPSTANQPLKTSISRNSIDDTTPDEYPSLESDTSAMHTVISDAETTKATMATSEDSEASKDNPQRYRFTAPQAFVGKHAHKEKLRRMQMPPPDIPDIARRNKRKGRRKKKASDGRMSIKELPNFDGDPIEDIEDD
ncbi:hypothetical protein PG985_015677 [Apiospora marii]|uniref:Uncharacterized protein n=1 Tax=Apiospora marii TaxID=335849 RepID=A0ABR1S4X1_9PEZI